MKDTILQRMFEAYYAIQNLKESILAKNDVSDDLYASFIYNKIENKEFSDFIAGLHKINKDGNLSVSDDIPTYEKVVEISDIIKTMIITKIQGELPKEAKK